MTRVMVVIFALFFGQFSGDGWVQANTASAESRQGFRYDIYNLKRIPNPPTFYRVLYRQVEECVGEKGNFDVITWMAADSMTQRPTDEPMAGLRYGNVVILKKKLALVPFLIRHESIHHIMDGASEHEEEFWKRCQFGPLPDGVDIPEGLG